MLVLYRNDFALELISNTVVSQYDCFYNLKGIRKTLLQDNLFATALISQYLCSQYEGTTVYIKIHINVHYNTSFNVKSNLFKPFFKNV